MVYTTTHTHTHIHPNTHIQKLKSSNALAKRISLRRDKINHRFSFTLCERFVFAAQCVPFYEVIVYSIWFMFCRFPIHFFFFFSFCSFFSSSFFMIHFSKRCMQTLTVTRKPAKGQFSSLSLIRHNRRLAIFSSVHQLNGEFYISFFQCFQCTYSCAYVCLCVRIRQHQNFTPWINVKYQNTSVQMKSKNLPTHYKISFINKIELLNGKSNSNKNNNSNSDNSHGSDSKVDIPNRAIGLIFNTWYYVPNWN